MSGIVFINYRRNEDGPFALLIKEKLKTAISEQNIFMDVDGLLPGDDYPKELELRVQQCDVMLTIIGPTWLNLKTDDGLRRLDQASDWVRIEVGHALRLGKRVIPVLVNRAGMPGRDELPPPLKPLADRHAVELRIERFSDDAKLLSDAVVRSIEKFEGKRILEEGGDIVLPPENPPASPPQPKPKPIEDTPAPFSPRRRSVLEKADPERDPPEPVPSSTEAPSPVSAASPPVSPAAPKPSTFTVPIHLDGGRSIEVDMLALPGGSFEMGGRRANEGPSHLSVVEPFAMMVTPVTVQQYAAVTGDPSANREEPQAPVTSISWIGAVQFCNLLSIKSGRTPAYRLLDLDHRELPLMTPAAEIAFVQWLDYADGFRLPLDAEYEYALRAGTKTDYFWGDDAAVARNYAWLERPAGNPPPVAGKQPNPWGFHDLSGNVCQWCWDEWSPEHHANGNPLDLRVVNPTGDRRLLAHTGTGAKDRVIRGCSFFEPARRMRSAFREAFFPRIGHSDLGIRCVCSRPK